MTVGDRGVPKYAVVSWRNIVGHRRGPLTQHAAGLQSRQTNVLTTVCFYSVAIYLSISLCESAQPSQTYTTERYCFDVCLSAVFVQVILSWWLLHTGLYSSRESGVELTCTELRSNNCFRESNHCCWREDPFTLYLWTVQILIPFVNIWQIQPCSCQCKLCSLFSSVFP